MSHDGGWSDYPRPPFAFRALARARQLASPTASMWYLFSESGLIGSAFFLGAVYVTRNPVFGALLLVSFPLVILIRASVIPREEWEDEKHTLRISNWVFLATTLAPSAVVSLGGFLVPSKYVTLSIGCITAYNVLLYRRRRWYQSTPDFFVPPSSVVSDKWEDAARKLERAIAKHNAGRDASAFYWSYVAADAYDEIYESERRPVLSAAAKQFAEISRTVMSFTYSHEFKAANQKQRVNQMFEQVESLLSVRVCDVCNEKRPVEQLRRVSGSGGFDSLVCDTCFSSEGSNSRSTTSGTSTSTGGGSGSEEDAEETDSWVGDGTQSEHSGSPRYDGMTVETACNILGLEQPVEDFDKVKSAYREVASDTHPDAGGSTEEFKRVVKAKDVLEKWVE